MEGFWVKQGGGWQYTSNGQSNLGRPAKSTFMPWGQAPAEWRQKVEVSGLRGKGPQLTKPTPTQGQQGTPDLLPLSLRRSIAPTPTTSVSKKGPGGFMDRAKEPQSLGRKALGFLGDNWKDVLGAVATGYGIYNQAQQQGKANRLSDEGIALSKQQWADREPMRKAFSGNFNKMPSQPDLTSTFADASNPFYEASHAELPSSGMFPATTNPAALTATLPGKLTYEQMIAQMRRRGIA